MTSRYRMSNGHPVTRRLRVVSLHISKLPTDMTDAVNKRRRALPAAEQVTNVSPNLDFPFGR
jgi:hypothetical protein